MSYEGKIWELNIDKERLMENPARRVRDAASDIGYDADREVEKLKNTIQELEERLRKGL